MNDSIFVYKDYGNIKFDIKSIMDRKNISVNQIVKKTGLHHQVIRRYYDGTFKTYEGIGGHDGSNKKNSPDFQQLLQCRAGTGKETGFNRGGRVSEKMPEPEQVSY